MDKICIWGEGQIHVGLHVLQPPFSRLEGKVLVDFSIIFKNGSSCQSIGSPCEYLSVVVCDFTLDGHNVLLFWG